MSGRAVPPHDERLLSFEDRSIDDDATQLLHGLLAAGAGRDVLPHLRHTGQLLLAAAVESKNCPDDAVARG